MTAVVAVEIATVLPRRTEEVRRAPFGGPPVGEEVRPVPRFIEPPVLAVRVAADTAPYGTVTKVDGSVRTSVPISPCLAMALVVETSTTPRPSVLDAPSVKGLAIREVASRPRLFPPPHALLTVRPVPVPRRPGLGTTASRVLGPVGRRPEGRAPTVDLLPTDYAQER